ncbi:MAG: hypothetical protein KBF93_26540 [Leptospiraceae bacterium]|nr:hypothetical protein [Leptospiraceae bacterium]
MQTEIVEINKGLILTYNQLIPATNGELVFIEQEADTFEYTVVGQSIRINKEKNRVIKRIVVEANNE